MTRAVCATRSGKQSLALARGARTPARVATTAATAATAAVAATPAPAAPRSSFTTAGFACFVPHRASPSPAVRMFVPSAADAAAATAASTSASAPAEA